MVKIKAQISKLLNCDVDFSDPTLDPNSLYAGISLTELKQLNIETLKNPYRSLLSVREQLIKCLLSMIYHK